MSRLRQGSGQAMVEFAVTATIFFTIIMFLFDGTRMLWNQLTLREAAAIGVRYATVHGSNAAVPQGPPPSVGPGYNNLKQKVRDNAFGLSPSTLLITATWEANSWDPGQRVTVTVAYPTRPLVGLFWRGQTFNLSAFASGQIVN